MSEHRAAPTDSGERKSPTFQDMTAPLEAYEWARQNQAAAAIIEATERRTIEEARLRSLREKAVKTEDATERTALIAEASALATTLTEVPSEPRLIAGDVTPEKLASLLAEHGGRLAVMDAEAGGIFAIMAGRYTRDGGLNLDVYLRGHSGDALRVDHVGRPSVHVRTPAITMVLTPQPDVIRSLADQPGFRGRGLLARFLYAVPASLVGTRKYENRATDQGARRTYVAVIQAILELPPAQEIDGSDAYYPLTLRDCHQAHRHLSRITKSDDLLPALDILEGRGFIRRVESTKGKGPGRPRSPTFKVNPKVIPGAQNPQNPQNSGDHPGFEDFEDFVRRGT